MYRCNLNDQCIFHYYLDLNIIQDTWRLLNNSLAKAWPKGLMVVAKGRPRWLLIFFIILHTRTHGHVYALNLLIFFAMPNTLKNFTCWQRPLEISLFLTLIYTKRVCESINSSVAFPYLILTFIFLPMEW